MSGHSTAPWSVSGHFSTLVVGPDLTLIARTDVTSFVGSDRKAENEANARLIAAAPDLAFETRAFVRWVRDNTGMVPSYSELREWADRFAAVHAKAEGSARAAVEER